MGLAFLLIATFLAAAALQPFVSRDDEAPGDQALVVLTLFFSLWVGLNWFLAMARMLTEGGLASAVAVFALAGVLGLRARFRSGSPALMAELPPPDLVTVGAAAALGGAFLYVVLRGSTAFVAEYDAMSYHLPKAVEILKAGTLPTFHAGDFRLAAFPWNYELLVADTLMLSGGDRVAFLPGLIGTIGFLATSWVILRHAWPSAGRAEVLPGLLFVAATPVLLMHADAFKNDTLFACFQLLFLHWLARWCAQGSPRDAILALLAIGLAFGTKPSAAFLVPGLLSAVWVHRRHLRVSTFGGPARVAATAASLLLAAGLLGCFWPLLNKAWTGSLLGEVVSVGGYPGFESGAVPRYSGWSNLWRFPLLAFWKPFSSRPDAVWAFWDRSWWFWPTYRSIYGHWGWLCSVLLAAIPLGLVNHGKEDAPARVYRATLSLAGLSYALLSLPQQYRVDGMFNSYPRFLLVIPLLVAMWALLPLMRRMPRAVHRAAGGGMILYFTGQACVYFALDATKPPASVWRLFTHPELRVGAGAAKVLDRVAGPDDVIAFDSGFGGMVYPLYGRGLTRTVLYLQVREGMPVGIPAQATWVVSDRSWNVEWGHPGVTHVRDYWLPVRPAPSREDQWLFNQLAKDPAWVLFYRDTSSQEAIFRRRTVNGTGSRPPGP